MDEVLGEEEESLVVRTAESGGRESGAPPSRVRTPGAIPPKGLGEPTARYEVLRSLGRGGMAEVYLARRTGVQGFAREVALKCIASHCESEETLERMFRTEALLASHLHHPGIAEAYDLLEIEGKLYLVLEYIDGVSVRTILGAGAKHTAASGSGRRTLDRVFSCHVVASVAEALHYAHGLRGSDGEPLGIVHRDVSASNIMVTRTGIPKLLDFGIAYARMRGRERTNTGDTRGTPAYMSPEQAAGQKVDGRSDLFSLGLVFVELLTGRRVFTGEGGEAAAAEVLARCDPARVMEATRELPGPLQRICRRALERRPTRRYETGGEFARAVRRYLAEVCPLYGAVECAAELERLGLVPGAVASPSTPLAVRGESSRRRRRTRLPVIGAACVLVGLAAAGLFPWHSRQGSGPPGRGAPRPAPAREEATAPVPDLMPPSVSAEPTEAAPKERGAQKDEPPVRPSVARSARQAQPRPTVTIEQRGEERSAPEKPTVQELRPTPEEAQGAANLWTSAERGVGGQPTEVARAEEGAVPRVPATSRSALLGFADRGTVASAKETLPRGTLLRARLTAELDPWRRREVQAATSEDLLRDGAVLIPRGSLLSCRAGGVTGDRIAVSCDGASSGARSWSFKAIALSTDDRVGIRVVDGPVASGTSFVVCVTESAFLE